MAVDIYSTMNIMHGQYVFPLTRTLLVSGPAASTQAGGTADFLSLEADCRSDYCKMSYCRTAAHWRRVIQVVAKFNSCCCFDLFTILDQLFQLLFKKQTKNLSRLRESVIIFHFCTQFIKHQMFKCTSK